MLLRAELRMLLRAPWRTALLCVLLAAATQNLWRVFAGNPYGNLAERDLGARNKQECSQLTPRGSTCKGIYGNVPIRRRI